MTNLVYSVSGQFKKYAQFCKIMGNSDARPKNRRLKSDTSCPFANHNTISRAMNVQCINAISRFRQAVRNEIPVLPSSEIIWHSDKNQTAR